MVINLNRHSLTNHLVASPRCCSGVCIHVHIYPYYFYWDDVILCFQTAAKSLWTHVDTCRQWRANLVQSAEKNITSCETGRWLWVVSRGRRADSSGMIAWCTARWFSDVKTPLSYHRENNYLRLDAGVNERKRWESSFWTDFMILRIMCMDMLAHTYTCIHTHSHYRLILLYLWPGNGSCAMSGWAE